MAVTALTSHVCRLGEGPTWDADNDRLIWTDIEGRTLHAIRADGSGFETWLMPDRVCSLGLTSRSRLIVAFPHSVQLFEPDTGIFDMLARFDHEPAHVRLNDGKVGPDGAFWVGSMDERPDRQKIGSLYRVTGSGKVEVKLPNDVHVSNGLAWSPDGGTMFYSDSRAAWIDRFDFDVATGKLSNRTRIATLDDATGRPDGAACDMLGRYWSAGVSAGYLNCFDRDGALVEHIKVPVAAPTMPCFGGPDLKTVFLTSLIEGVSEERMAAHPLSGRLVTLEVGVAGAPVHLFREGA
jgi:sugar lactone lactonase YvrE